MFTLFGDGEFLPDDDFNKILANVVCPLPGVDEICGNLLFLVCGFDEKNMNFVCIYLFLFTMNVKTKVAFAEPLTSLRSSHPSWDLSERHCTLWSSKMKI